MSPYIQAKDVLFSVQVCRTRPSVSTVSRARTAPRPVRPTANPALLRPTPTRAPPFANSATRTNTQVRTALDLHHRCRHAESLCGETWSEIELEARCVCSLLFSSGRLGFLQTATPLHTERLLLHPHSLRLSGPGSIAQIPP